MKVSKYNLFYDFPNDSQKVIAYNSRSNALALIERENYSKYQDGIENITSIDDDLAKDLKKGGFLIDKDVDELGLLRHNMLTSRYGSNHLSLTIAPTLDCDFACIYCYEKGQRKEEYMSEEVQDAVVKYLDEQSKYVDNISIAWYGGEPLLALDIIESITKKALEICEKRNIEYSSFIVTNGYNLTRDVAERLQEYKVEFIQVTIDGLEDVHNLRRPLKDGEPTFGTIIKNLSQNIDILPLLLRKK